MSVYLITSPSSRLTKNEIKKITENNYVVTINLAETSIDNLFEELSYFSFDNEKKSIIVYNAAFLGSKAKKEDNDERIIKYLNNPIDTANLIFINDSVDSRKKSVKIIKEKHNFISLEIDYKNIYNLINDYIITNKFKCDASLSKYLVSLYALNIDLIFNELDKLFMFYDEPCFISMEDAKNIISKPYDDNSFHFVNAVVNKKVNDIYKIWDDLKIYKVDSIALFAMLYREFKLMFLVKKLLEQRKSNIEICKIVGLQDWQMKKIYDESLNFTAKELLSYIKSISEYDVKIKSGKIDKNNALHNLLLEIIA